MMTSMRTYNFVLFSFYMSLFVVLCWLLSIIWHIFDTKIIRCNERGVWWWVIGISLNFINPPRWQYLWNWWPFSPKNIIETSLLLYCCVTCALSLLSFDTNFSFFCLSVCFFFILYLPIPCYCILLVASLMCRLPFVRYRLRWEYLYCALCIFSIFYMFKT